MRSCRCEIIATNVLHCVHQARTHAPPLHPFLAASQMRKAANRTMFDFNKAEEEYIDGDEVVGLGVLGSKEGSGQLRVVANQQKLRLNAKQQKKYKGRLGGVASTSTAVNGLSSSLAFTPVQVGGLTAGVALRAAHAHCAAAESRACSCNPPSPAKSIQNGA